MSECECDRMSFGQYSRSVALLCAMSLMLGACGEAAPQNGPGSMADAAKGSELISDRHFGRLTVPCDNPEVTARALLQLTSRDLADDARPRLLDYGTDEVRLKDGSGTIAVIVYAVSAEDEQAVVTTTEHFLMNDRCQVLHWSSAVAPTG